MKAAILHGPEDLRIEHVPQPAGDVVVEVHAATTCGTDVKMWRHGHPALAPYPCRFGHETAGVRVDTGERVLVSDSVACGACAPCVVGRSQICRELEWVLGGFAELIAAPAAAIHAIPAGLPAAAARPRRRGDRRRAPSGSSCTSGGPRRARDRPARPPRTRV